MGLEPRTGSYTEPFSFFTGTDLPLIYHVHAFLNQLCTMVFPLHRSLIAIQRQQKTLWNIFFCALKKYSFISNVPLANYWLLWVLWVHMCKWIKTIQQAQQSLFSGTNDSSWYFLENQNHRKQCSTSDSYSYEIFFVNETHTASSCVMLHWWDLNQGLLTDLLFT